MPLIHAVPKRIARSTRPYEAVQKSIQKTFSRSLTVGVEDISERHRLLVSQPSDAIHWLAPTYQRSICTTPLSLTPCAGPQVLRVTGNPRHLLPIYPDAKETFNTKDRSTSIETGNDLPLAVWATGEQGQLRSPEYAPDVLLSRWLAPPSSSGENA